MDWIPLAFFAGGPDAYRLPLEMLLVIGSAKLLSELLQRLRQPGIVGEILAGALLGPAALNLIAPNELLHTFSELGVMFLLFSVGLHVKPSELKSVGKVATIAGLMGVVAPFLAGWGLLRAWGEPQIESIFMGAAMVATSVGITAQVLAADGLLSLKASRIILIAAVIDDILGLLVLAVVSSLAKGPINYLELGTTAGISIAFVVFVVQFGAPALTHMVPRMRERMQVAEGDFVLSLVLLFGLSVMAVYAGVAAIIGAFLAGMALSESVRSESKHMVHGATELLVPFFLVNIGINLDFKSFQSREMIVLAILVVVAAVLSKLVGCGLGAWSLGRTDAIRVGVGMVPRGEVGMVVAQIGLGMGVISQSIYGVAVFMAVVTTMVAPPLLKWAYKGAKAEEAAAS